MAESKSKERCFPIQVPPTQYIYTHIHIHSTKVDRWDSSRFVPLIQVTDRTFLLGDEENH